MPKNKNSFRKAYHEPVTRKLLSERHAQHAAKGYSKAKWIQFCETLLDAGFKLELYEARRTFSKYITVSDGNQFFKVRFSNHRPIKHRELQGDCDFFVGVTHTGYRTTDDAIREIEKAFGFDIRRMDGAA